MAGAADTLRLEGFGESVKGHRVACVATSPRTAEAFVRGRVAVLDADVAHRGRKILVVQGGSAAPRWLTSIGWDATFHVRDVADLKLALTHIQHATRPARVVWFGSEPQAAVLAALAKMEGLTFLSVMDRTPMVASHEAWQAILWAPDAGQEDIEAAVGARMGTGAVGGQLRAVLKELRASNVGLVWSAIGETDRRGSLYWYDPQEGGDLQPALDLGEAADMLRRVADMLVVRSTQPPF
jgi:hypothetical protein